MIPAIHPCGPNAFRLHTRHGYLVIDAHDAYTISDLLVDAAETLEEIYEGTEP